MTGTYNDLYMNLRQDLRRAGIEAATPEAKELVCFATGKTPEELLRDGQLYAPENVVRELENLKQRRLAGEPVAYLIGEWSFYGLDLDINESVLIPRTDTEVLAQEAICHVQSLGACRILDLCSGSGCVGLAVASKCPEAQVVCAELSEGALRIIRQNIRRTGLTGRVVPLMADARQAPELRLGEFQCIVCNPPYIPRKDIETLDVSVRDYEPRMALDGGESGLDFYEDILKKWTRVLMKNGKIFFEVGIGQANDVLRLMRSVGFGDLEIARDSGGIQRVVSGRLHDSLDA